MIRIGERLGEAHYPKTAFCDFVVDEARCSGCGRCVETCPGQLLSLVEGEPSIRGAEESGLGCIGCRNCVAVCPADAITIGGFYQVEEGPYRTLLRPPRLPNPFAKAVEPEFREVSKRVTEVERVIYTRRSNRLFKKKAVPAALVRRIVEAGRFAPSAGNCQPWAFVIIQDRRLLDEIAAGCLPLLEPMPAIYFRNASRGAAVERGRSFAVNVMSRLSPNNFDQRLIGGINTVVRNKDWDMFLHASSAILVLGDKRGVGDPKLDCGIAAQNMVLAAHSLGLGTCYVGFSKIVNFVPRLKRKLGVRWPYEVVTSIAIGYPKGDNDKAVAREVPPITWFPADGTGPQAGI